MIRKIVTNGWVAAFPDIFFTVDIFLFFIAAVDRLLNSGPAEVICWELAFEDWRALAQSWENRSEWNEHIVQIACMLNTLCLIGDLETRVSHAKVHSIHIDLACKRLLITCIHIRVNVSINGSENLNFLLSALTNGLGETKESWVRACCELRDKIWVCAGVILAKALIIGCFNSLFHIEVTWRHRIRRADDYWCGCGQQFNFAVTILGKNFAKNLAPKAKLYHLVANYLDEILAEQESN